MAKARGGAAPDARRVRRAALPRARPAGIQARAVAAEGRSRARGCAEGARCGSGRRPTRRRHATDRRAEHAERAAAGPHWPPRPFGPQEVAVMAEATSPAIGRPYGVARVCRVWEVAKSSFYAARQAGADGTEPAARPARRGPKPAISEQDLLTAIRADLARSPWTGEGHRKAPWHVDAVGGRPPHLGPAAGSGRHPGLTQAGAAADARARPALAAAGPPAAAGAAPAPDHHGSAERHVGDRRHPDHHRRR